MNGDRQEVDETETDDSKPLARESISARNSSISKHENSTLASSASFSIRTSKHEDLNANREKLCVIERWNKQDWNGTLAWVKRNPKEAAETIIDSNNKNTTILHKTLASKSIDMSSRLSIVTQILERTPCAANILNYHKSLPLHVAVRNNVKMDAQSREKMIKLLISANPSALTQGDSGEHTPLHIACDKWCSIGEAKLLIDTAPEAASMEDAKGYLPIHIACSRRCSPEKLKLLLAAYPGCLNYETKNGDRPLCIARKCATPKHPNSTLIQMLDEASSIAARPICTTSIDRSSAEGGLTSGDADSFSNDSNECDFGTASATLPQATSAATVTASGTATSGPESGLVYGPIVPGGELAGRNIYIHRLETPASSVDPYSVLLPAPSTGFLAMGPRVVSVEPLLQRANELVSLIRRSVPRSAATDDLCRQHEVAMRQIFNQHHMSWIAVSSMQREVSRLVRENEDLRSLLRRKRR